MEFIREATEAQMVSLFLASELRSDRWRDSLLAVLTASGVSTDLIEHPDTSSEEENRSRAAVLAAFRGYGEGRCLFEGYTAGVRWFRAVLGAADIPRLKYIRYSYWDAISGGTRRPLDAAATIRAGTEVFGVPNDPYFDGARFLRRGGTFPPLILVSSGAGDLFDTGVSAGGGARRSLDEEVPSGGGARDSPETREPPGADYDLVILEGNVRATVYAFVEADSPGPVEALVGFHGAFRMWV